MSKNRPLGAGNARFIEIGAASIPMRSLINVDHISNVRFEENFTEIESPLGGVQMIPNGWQIALAINDYAQSFAYESQADAVYAYNLVLDMIANVGCPISRLGKLKAEYVDPYDDVPPLTDEEVAALENPEIDVDAIANAINGGLDDTKIN
jgi:hypothetical protein